MSAIRIYGLHGLKGKVNIQGSKNAVLPVMAASLLNRGTTVITGVPRIQDVYCMVEILEYLGCRCIFLENTLTVDTSRASKTEIPRNLAGRMRSSIMLIGPMLGRFGCATTFHPGGCSIGKRPIDLHLTNLEKMGTDVVVDGERIQACTSGLKGTEIFLSFPSVGATENIIMAAVLAEGITVLTGGAREPEVEALCQYLTQAGADIKGIGSDRLVIKGVKQLSDTCFSVPGDRIVAGTYLGAALAAEGEVQLCNAPVKHMSSALQLAEKMGARLWVMEDGLGIKMRGCPLAANMETGPYPEFPTDLQSVMMAVCSVAQGVSEIREEIFEQRFSTAKELQKMGAHIIIEENLAQVTGAWPLRGTRVCATDLRGGAALVVAGLAAEGETIVEGYSHIQRGYEDIGRDLRMLGANVEAIDSMEE